MPEMKYEGSRYTLSGTLPEIGDTAPDFSLVASDLRDVSLSHWRERRKILNIFPTLERAAALTTLGRLADIVAPDNGVTIFAVSMDAPFAQKRLLAPLERPDVVGLSGVRSAGFARNYGVAIENGILKDFYARGTVVIDENDTIVYTQLLDDVDDEPDYRRALRAIGIAADGETEG